MMLFTTVNGCELHIPTSGGKAGKGHNKTGSVQVRKGGQILKQFRFRVDDPNDKTWKLELATRFAREQK
jgi:hypothetical protein